MRRVPGEIGGTQMPPHPEIAAYNAIVEVASTQPLPKRQPGAPRAFGASAPRALVRRSISQTDSHSYHAVPTINRPPNRDRSTCT